MWIEPDPTMLHEQPASRPPPEPPRSRAATPSGAAPPAAPAAARVPQVRGRPSARTGLRSAAARARLDESASQPPPSRASPSTPAASIPPTLGHLDLIERASALFSDVIVAIGVHPTRSPLFTVDERVDLVQRVSRAPAERARSSRSTACSSTSASEEARASSSAVCARRPTSSTSSRSRTPTPTSSPRSTRSSCRRARSTASSRASLVREIASHGGDVSRYAPGIVCDALTTKFALRRA